MTEAPELSSRQLNRIVPRITGGTLALLGGVALAGWLLHVESLKSIIPGAAAMKPNMAAGFLVCGTALALVSRMTSTKSIRIYAMAIAATVVGLAVLTLGEHFFSWDFPIEQWLVSDQRGPLRTPHPGRMAAASALGFLLAGSALFAASLSVAKRLRFPLVLGLSAALVFIGGTPLAAFLLELSLGPEWNFMGMDISGVAGAIGFMLVGSGLLALLESEGRLTWSLNRLTTAGFAFGILLMVLAAAAGFKFTKQMLETTTSLNHTQEILNEIENIKGNMVHHQNGERGYIITGDDNLLEEREQRKTDIRRGLNSLRKLTTGDAINQRQLDQLERLYAQRDAWEEEIILIRREQGFLPAQQLVITGKGIALWKTCQVVFTDMENAEYSLLDTRRRQSDAASRRAFSILPSGVFLSLIILSLGIFSLNSGVTEQKQTEAELRESEARYRSLFESNPNPMWVYDLETLSFLAVNAAAVRHYGYSPDEFLTMTIKDIRPTEEISALMADLSRETGTDGLDNSTQWRHCKKGGMLIDVEITSHELTWLGRPAKLVLINDITERKQAQETLQEQAALFDQTYDAVLVWDWEGLITFWNRGAENLYGYTSVEAVGNTAQQLLHAQITVGLQTVIQALARDGVWEGEVQHTTNDGRHITVESRMVLVRDAKREYVLEINRDITERKRGEERLREQARLLDLAQDAIMVRDMEDRIEFWNHGAEQLYGWTAAEVQGKKASGFLYEEEPAAIAAARAAVIEDGKWTGECKHIRQDGGAVMVRSRWTLVRDALAAPKSILIINTDITEQKKLETHLLRAQRLESIGTLASGVAHDLNNILTPILICAQSLQRGASEEDVKSMAALMEISAKRGASVVKQVLTFARGVEGERVLINPSHLIEEMVDLARKTFSKSIEIKSRYPENLWSIEGDPTQLHQVLLNFSVNARDAMPQGGSLIIAAENFEVDEHYASISPGAKAGPHVLLRVSDTGTGISREVIDKIFDPFFTTKEVGKGTGLGLSTVFGIVKSHGGFISVYSEIGRGTTFQIFLPAQLKDVPNGPGITTELLEGRGELVLLVDDEANILRVTKTALENQNYQVVAASDGREALKIFSEQSDAIKAVLTDMDLPRLGGVALAREIRRMKPEMAVIASTGQGEHTNVAELESFGVVNFLTKPYDTAKLLMTLKTAMATTPSKDTDL
ncbi:MAG: hypothetical protein QOI34_1254 [Verrucomicrobiota bacterium]